MLNRIPPEFIDSLLGRVDIVELINSRVTLKKAGQNFIARCPFHSEKTPSFTVSPIKQFYYCFGCGAHGSAIGFLMDYERLSFRDAVANLASRAGLDLPREDTTQPNNPIDLRASYTILEQADKWFRKQLRTHPQAINAINYLKQRGLTGQIALEYGLGYAPPGWEELYTALGTNELAVQNLLQNGLIIEQAGNYHDRFRNRIIFPIRDKRGRTIGFGGRVLGDEKPKYLNSPETPLFHKGQELYGLYEAMQAVRHIEQILIVEGYMDVIACAQLDIRYTVATLGTATTLNHLESLFRICKRLIFCFDGDQAGRQAAWRAVNIVLPLATEGREIRFLFLPEGEDPDTLIRKIGTAAFTQLLKQARQLSEVIFEHLGAGLDLDSLDNRARLAEQIRALIEKIPAGIYRDMLFAHLEHLTGLPIKNLSTSYRPKSRSPLPPNNDKTPLSLARRASALLLQAPKLITIAINMPNDWYTLQQSDTELLRKLISMLTTQPNLTTAALIERWRDTAEFAEVNKLAQYSLLGSDTEEFHATLQNLNTLAKKQQALPIPSGSRPSDLTYEQKEQIKQLLAPNQAQHI